MRFIRFRYGPDNEIGLGRHHGRTVEQLAVHHTDWVDLLQSGARLETVGSSRVHATEDVTLLAPVVRPSKVLGIGENHRDFLKGLGQEPQTGLALFHKTAASLTGPHDPIVIPPNSTQAVPEGELAVIVARRASRIAVQEAEAHIAGYTCANDVTARDLEFQTSQWTAGKMLDTFCPIGPSIVTPDEISDVDRLSIETTLNGVEIQRGSTEQLVVGPRELIARLSWLVTLEPGDVVLTGTPSDLGAREPPVFLADGDEICVRIDHVGQIGNRVRAHHNPREEHDS